MNKQFREKIIIIVNPVSGVRKGRMGELSELVEHSLDLERFDPEIKITRYAGHGAEIAQEGLESGIRRFIVVGGDGSINEVAEKLVDTDAILGIIPAGSGNGLAHHLGIPRKKRDAVELINRDKIVKIDTCAVNGVFFASIAGIGFDASVARQFAKSNRRGFLTYAKIVLREYLSYKPLKYNLNLDGDELETKAFFISFANSSQFGYNTQISPQASITDGLIDVCVVRKPPVTAFPAIARLMYQQKINQTKYIEIYRAANILVKRKKGKTVNVDGEAVKLGKRLHITIRPSSLNVVVP